MDIFCMLINLKVARGVARRNNSAADTARGSDCARDLSATTHTQTILPEHESLNKSHGETRQVLLNYRPITEADLT